MSKNKYKKNMQPMIYITLIATTLSTCVHKNGTSVSYKEDLAPFKPVYTYQGSSTYSSNNFTQSIQARPSITPTEYDNQQLESKLVLIREKNKTIKYTQGYRILAYSGINQELAMKAKEAIYQLFPDSDPEVQYNQPNFKVKVGSFYDRQEAQAMYMKLRKSLPEAVIVSERITIDRGESNHK